MALNDIVFVKGQGGLGRPLPGEDHISSLLFYTSNGNLPSGFSTTDRIKQFLSLQDAEAKGIVNDYSDATPATAQYVITDPGAIGDTIKIVANEPFGKVVALATYKTISGDTDTSIATKVVALINAGTITHGYTATADAENIDLVFPKKLGSYPNTGTPLTVTITGTITGTLTLGNDGYHSRLAIWHYHISEYFRVQPKGNLFVGIFAYPNTFDFAEITTIQNFAQGKIRQIAVYAKWRNFISNAVADIQAIDEQIKTNNDANHAPLSALYAGKMVDIDLTTLSNLQLLSANKVSAVISQDLAGQGGFLYITSGQSITTIGATLGAVSLSKVSDDIAWIGKYNISNGTECDTIGFANGQKLSEVSQGLVNLLDDYRYIFLVKYVGIAGSYFNDSHTSIVVSSDYAYIENNRTIDKAIRGVYASLLPDLNSPLVLNADGTLSDNTVAFFESQASTNLTQMVRDSELSAFDVVIDPSQNVLSTSTLVIAVKLVPIGVARQITINIGFTLSI